MAWKIVASANELMKHFPIACCTLHICLTSPHVSSERSKAKKKKRKKEKKSPIIVTVRLPQGPRMQVKVALTIISKCDCTSRVLRFPGRWVFPSRWLMDHYSVWFALEPLSESSTRFSTGGGIMSTVPHRARVRLLEIQSERFLLRCRRLALWRASSGVPLSPLV